MFDKIRLGVNIDHVATIRNARGGPHPDPVRAAKAAENAGADGITAHLREDRRHISDQDILRLKQELKLPLNLEMAPTEEMLSIALHHKPHAVCLVPEKRQEVTTEGGIDVINSLPTLKKFVEMLTNSGSRVSLFIDPDLDQIEACAELNAPVVEFHVGAFCNASTNSNVELERILKAARKAEKLGIECHAGHGLTYESVGEIATIPNIVELNIGHFIIGESIFCGLETVIQKFQTIIEKSRTERK